MERFGGIDAAFLGMETEAVHAHVVAVSVYDPEPSPFEFNAEHARRLLSSKLDQIPAFRRRLVEVPGGVALPYWIDDRDFDIADHVEERRIDAPGGRRELAAAIGEIMSTKLDRSRPLWSLTVLTGLEDGRVAHALKMHHAAVDGATGVAIMGILNTPDASDTEIGPPAKWDGADTPGSASVLAAGIGDSAKASLRAIAWGARLLPTLIPARGGGSGRAFPRLRRAPRLSFNRSITGRRAVAFSSIDFAEVRRLGKATGTTINDVTLAIIAGALRDWLEQRGELPDAPLIAGVPVSTRAAGDGGDGGSNQVTAVMAGLPVHLDDPVARLEFVHQDMSAQKKALASAPPDLAERMAALLPPLLTRTAAEFAGSASLADLLPVTFNVGVSNVPGARERLYCTGAPLLSHYGFAFLPHGAALNITLDSYVDKFDVSLLTCPDLVDDLWPLADRLKTALADLATAIDDRFTRSLTSSESTRS